ncbi:ankyrin repeat and EF-hand domain-containing protein 1-like [Ptychodera flava]|uniref:ankyrin repeat and EF-hand domain-containing protein 1-like n=1 Tax=Ptychodera flava TaxID=63121 RepID=UPI00396A031A
MPIAETRLEILQIHKLLQCVRQEDREQIEKLCNHGVPHLVNYSEPSDGETALHLAAINNNEEMVKFLLDLGAHPNVVDLKGRTAVMRAAEYGHIQTLEILVSAGSDLKLTDVDGQGILFYCMTPTSRHTKCVDIALEYGADCNNKSNKGVPVFFAACETAAENENVCMALLSKGADPNSKNEATQQTSLIAAASSGSVTVVRAILQAGGDVNAIDREKITASHLAAGGGHFDVLKILATFAADFNVQSVVGNTPVHHAAKGGHAMCCKFLGQRGCRANVKNDDGQLPSQVAKDNGSKDAMKDCKKVEKLWKKISGGGKPPVDSWAVQLYDWTIEHGQELLQKFQNIDLDKNIEPVGKVTKEEFSDTILAASPPVEEEDIKKVFQLHDKNRENLIDYEEFLGGKKYVHKTYLMSAFEKKEKKKKGGKKGGKKKKGKTKVPMPICTAPEGPRTEGGGPPEHLIGRHVPFSDTGRFDRDNPPEHPIQDDSIWYLSPPEKTYMNINDAARLGDLESLKRAFWEGRNVDTRDKYYKTPLMVACHYGNQEMVDFLMENGANVNAQDNFKWTPLHHACHAGQIDIVQQLVGKGAEIDAAAMNGGTPLMRAVQSSKPDVVQFLIEKGAKVQQQNRKGETAMEIAMWWAEPRVVQIVKEKFDSLPKPKEGKGKKGKKSAKGKKKDPQRAASVPPIPQTSNLTQMPVEASTPPPRRERKSSVLRVASAMAGGVEHVEDVTYTPIKAWTHQHTTRDLIIKKEQRRKRFGYEVDFPDFEMPFKENFMNKSKALGGVDPDDDDD